MILGPAPMPVSAPLLDAKPVPAIISAAPFRAPSASGDEEFQSFTFSFRGRQMIATFAPRAAERPAEPDAKPLRKKSLPLEVAVQEGNACGPTSLYMVLRAERAACTEEEVANTCVYSPLDGTSPMHLRQAAAKFGMFSSVVNDTSDKTLTDLIDSGGYALALVQRWGGLHYVVIHGYEVDRSNRLTLHVADPNGTRFNVSMRDFNEEWSDINVRGLGTGMNRLMVAVSRSEVPEDNFGGLGKFLSNLHAFFNELQAFASSLGTFLSNFFSTLGALSMHFEGPPALEKKRFL